MNAAVSNDSVGVRRGRANGSDRWRTPGASSGGTGEVAGARACGKRTRPGPQGARPVRPVRGPATRAAAPRKVEQRWQHLWIGYTYLDDSGRTKPAFLNSTGAMYPKVECSLKLLYQCT